MSRISKSSALTARAKISLARTRNSFANNKSCSAISHSVRFRREHDQSLGTDGVGLADGAQKIGRAAKFLSPAPCAGDKGVGGSRGARPADHTPRFNAEPWVVFQT